MTALSCLAAIVLLMDVSGSVPDRLYVAQRDGAAGAFADRRLLQAIEAQGVAVLVAEFDTTVTTRLGWQLLRDADQARDFAEALRALRRSSRDRPTSIGRAIAHAAAALRDAPCVAFRRVIDVATDGFETDRSLPASIARDDAAAEGIVINAIAFFGPDDAMIEQLSTEAGLAEAEAWLRENVATGFVHAADGLPDFDTAFRRKVVLEITESLPAR
ncbi:DUF1194 domain-containing protein [Falsiroseomonas sp. HW251]|uniref:DUF1194 domain-containing protein n=1 Tax=Falsiroseomonas sp. HW251 TaxID=3390998 RepID=UPI003D319FDF